MYFYIYKLFFLKQMFCKYVSVYVWKLKHDLICKKNFFLHQYFICRILKKCSMETEPLNFLCLKCQEFYRCENQNFIVFWYSMIVEGL